MPFFRENAPEKGGHHERRTAARIPQDRVPRAGPHPEKRPAGAGAPDRRQRTAPPGPPAAETGRPHCQQSGRLFLRRGCGRGLHHHPAAQADGLWAGKGHRRTGGLAGQVWPWGW